MIRHPIRCVLLVALLYWASGFARFVHERLEHEGAESCAITVADAAKQSVALPSHSPDDCAVCQALATMGSDQPVAAALPIITLERTGSVVPAAHRALSCGPLLTTHPRGPPAFIA